MAKLSELPSKDILVQCTTLATTAKAAGYLALSIERIFEKARVLEEFKGLVQKFHEHAETVVDKEREPPDIWRGILPTELKMQMDVDVRKKTTTIERGYLEDNATPDDKTTEQMDSLFHDWLAKAGWTCKDSIICEASERAKPKRDAAGALIPVDPKVLEEKLLAQNKGLQAYVNSHAAGLAMEALHVEVKEGGPEIEPDVSSKAVEKPETKPEVSPDKKTGDQETGPA